MKKIFNNALIEKRNILNEVRNNNMSLQELRFFSIYLSLINSRDISSRVVRFPLDDFKKIMELGRLNKTHLQNTTDKLLSKVISVPNKNGGYTSFQLFKECTVSQDNLGEWYIEIDAHDKALPLMFDFKNKYFTYELWNALRLKSSNQLRMYELLKQYEKLGTREIRVSELRELLGILPTEYPRWERFRTRVIDSCQEALTESTDICFTYERGKVGRGGTWLTIIFKIKKNENYIDQLTLNEFINLQQPSDPFDNEDEFTKNTYSNEFLELLGEACNHEFSEEQLGILNSSMNNINLPLDKDFPHQAKFLYLNQKYKEFKHRATQTKITNRFGYFKKMVENQG